MQKRPPDFANCKTGQNSYGCEQISHNRSTHGQQDINSLSVQSLKNGIDDWLFEGELQQHSPRTIEFRRHFGQKLIWFLERQDFSSCGVTEIRQFLAYIAKSHEDPKGRWDNPRCIKPVRPVTLLRYYRELNCFFNWAVREAMLPDSPVRSITRPRVNSEQIQPFSQEQIEALRRAARRSHHPRRDETIVLFLLDTGVRVSELCNLKMSDLDLQGRRCTVIGKGNKRRTIHFGKTAGKFLWQYLREQTRDADDPVFLSDRGKTAGEPLTRSGVQQLIERLGNTAKLQAVRCSPHTFRHTFAVEFLRAGGNVFSLQQMLGHSGLHITNRYVALAQADLEHQHQQFSPADRLRRE